jgi:hypothetical protein
MAPRTRSNSDPAIRACPAASPRWRTPRAVTRTPATGARGGARARHQKRSERRIERDDETSACYARAGEDEEFGRGNYRCGSRGRGDPAMLLRRRGARPAEGGEALEQRSSAASGAGSVCFMGMALLALAPWCACWIRAAGLYMRPLGSALRSVGGGDLKSRSG